MSVIVAAVMIIIAYGATGEPQVIEPFCSKNNNPCYYRNMEECDAYAARVTRSMPEKELNIVCVPSIYDRSTED